MLSSATASTFGATPSKSLTYLWGATGEQEWTPALTTGKYYGVNWIWWGKQAFSKTISNNQFNSFQGNKYFFMKKGEEEEKGKHLNMTLFLPLSLLGHSNLEILSNTWIFLLIFLLYFFLKNYTILFKCLSSSQM